MSTISADQEYLVQPGDTLVGISKRLGVDLTELMYLNSILDARLLHAGQRLRIRDTKATLYAPKLDSDATNAQTSAETVEPMTSNDPITSLTGGTFYYVRDSDTLSLIANRFNVTVPAILAANNLPDEKQIRPGVRITIPSASAVLSVAASEAQAQTPQPQVGVLGIGDPTTPVVSAQEIAAFLKGRRTTFYVVRKGDTIPSVALLFKMDPLILAQINQVRVEGDLTLGTRLVIPMK